MEATQRDIEALLELQEVDIAAINARRKMEQLPQRAALQELGEKKQAVMEKLAQVGKMHDAARRKVTQLEDEEDILQRKQGELQEKIDGASGDFRAVQSLTRDLEGVAKRLTTVRGEQEAALEKYNQVNAVKKQAETAVRALDAQALQLRDAFQQGKAELEAVLSEAQRDHDRIAAGISPEVLKAYDDACKRAGGIGVAQLAENRCSTCRNVVDPNRLLIVKREAPLSQCPSCRRLLIVAG